MTERGITRVSSDLVDQIVYTKTVAKGSFKPGDLQKLETQTINKYINEGHIIYNTNKRVEVARSNSRSTSRTSSIVQPEPDTTNIVNQRLERMRSASNNIRNVIAQPPKPIQ